MSRTFRETTTTHAKSQKAKKYGPLESVFVDVLFIAIGGGSFCADSASSSNIALGGAPTMSGWCNWCCGWCWCIGYPPSPWVDTLSSKTELLRLGSKPAPLGSKPAPLGSKPAPLGSKPAPTLPWKLLPSSLPTELYRGA
jgi:hypothetical protein